MATRIARFTRISSICGRLAVRRTRDHVSENFGGTMLLLIAVLLQTPSPPPRELVTRAVAAMGGESALRGLRALSVDFYTMTFALGQEETPASPPRANISIGQQITDYAGSRQTGTIELRNVAGQVNKLRRVTAGGIGMTETNGRPAPDGPVFVAGIERGMRRAPERLLITALDNLPRLEPLTPKSWRGETLPGARYAFGPDTLDLYFDRRSGLPVVIETLTDDPILGDRRTVTTFTRWQDAGNGLLYPRQYDIEVNGRLQTHSVFTAVTTNPPVADSLFVIPDSIASRAQRSNPTPPPPVITVVELAPTVWRVEGGSHHTLVVDQGTRLVLVEAPQSAARMEAVLDTIRARFPNKRIAYVINTHHHWDHAGGLRTVLAAGLQVITHARNATFVRDIAKAPKTVRPDALSTRRGAPLPEVTTVEDSLVVGTGDGRVVAYRLPTAHAEGLLAVYVPSARILFQSDVVNAAPTPPPTGSAELIRFVKARGLAVDRVAGGHGLVLPWADVERAAAPASAP
jgi:glyoxylase-like metal-dependent hydrolase (beta-lactamase superfamily II)